MRSKYSRYNMFLLAFQSSPIHSRMNDRILATVGNHNITLSEFNERYTNYLSSTGVKDNLFVREAILRKRYK